YGQRSPVFNRRWLRFSILFTVIVLTVANLQEITGFWRYYGPKWFVHFGGEKTEPTIQGTDYTDIQKRFEKEGWLTNPKIFTGSTRWWLTGK
ncbi:hypothetical protein, partial [Enterococcus faecium]|uniref:hypothetical protein n=1 Tax=Enterococcus faecium TaxID=1352 RepID=UPI003F42E160